MLIRAEEQRDWAAVHAVNVSAFETAAEANLVDALREQAQPLVSLIAEDNGAIPQSGRKATGLSGGLREHLPGEHGKLASAGALRISGGGAT